MSTNTRYWTNVQNYGVFIPRARHKCRRTSVENGNTTYRGRSPSHYDEEILPSRDQRYQSFHLPTPELTTYGGIKLGWIQGVLIPCLLNIWGVMLFLRIAWVVAQAGIGLTIFIIFLSGVVCVITTLSLCALCTNGELQGGGVYYLVSRSLGAELGASVGIIFAFANAVAASMNTIGFCDSLNGLLSEHGLRIVDNSINDVRIVGAVALCVMCIICAIGMDWETKAQNFLIVVIVLAIFNYLLGCFVGPTNNQERAQGFVGLDIEVADENWAPDFRQEYGEHHDFFTIFAIYFPAVTGVQAGANICGDLKNPATAIPKGTLLALAISISSYLVMALLAGFGALRDASGNIADIANGTLDSCKPDCSYGLHHNYRIMHIMSLWEPLIYGGCWAATLSTALTNLLSVPRLIQALGVDRIYPGLIFFSKPYGRHGEPYRGYVLTFIVSLLFLLIGDLNRIAPLITNFYLASYSLINFCTFHAGLVRHISWRPTFHYYNIWLSFAGFLMCVTIMVIISWVMALITVFIFLTLYLLVHYRKPEANWGSSTEAQQYRDTINMLLQLSHRSAITQHIKSYNPQILVLSGRPYLRPALLDVAHLITKIGSFMVVADITREELSYSKRIARLRTGDNWLRMHKYRAFYVLLDGMGLERGALTLLQTTGFGHLKPNILLIGYKEDWPRIRPAELKNYVRIIQHAYEYQVAVCVFRPPEYARVMPNFLLDPPSQYIDEGPRTHSRLLAVMHSHSDIELTAPGRQRPADEQPALEAEEALFADEQLFLIRENEEDTDVKEQARGSASSSPSLMILPQKSTIYKPLTLQPNQNVDAWWLYDDGGLNILLPYIISQRGFKDKLPLRIFVLARTQHRVEEAEKYIVYLLEKFRIAYTSLTLVHGIDKPPQESTKEFFNQLVSPFKTTDNRDGGISEAELQRQQAKTSRHLRLRELLLEHSTNATFIVMTLPLPRQGLVSPALYMCWLEVLSHDLPPMLFVRGNDLTVLDA